MKLIYINNRKETYINNEDMNTNKQHKGFKKGLVYWFYQMAIILFVSIVV